MAYDNGVCGVNNGDLLGAEAYIWNQMFGFMNSFNLKTAVELGIPDIIHNHGKPMKLSDLVAALPINQSKGQCIGRLMRSLALSGFFLEKIARENELLETEYTLTPTCRLLLTDNPFTLSPFLLAMLDPSLINSWQYLTAWLQNDDPTAFNTANGTSFWDYAGHKPTLNFRFNDGMSADSRLVASVMIKECKEVFEGLSSVVDVGGGAGTMATAIVEAFPHLKCTVFDQPHVVANLQGRKNLSFVGGSIHDVFPAADAILLKWILHFLGDEDCITLLKKCKQVIPSKENGGKVIIIDMVTGISKGAEESVQTQFFYDMLMMINVAGKERNKKEWAELFCKAGFSDYKIHRILGLRSLIEAYP
ncbi:trans-resveratrol di-O-methyltransferase-like [Diospyros lotus]|uniref:trans-resveratrol di-O-methyltransferase-like n=1 Tax=Diospyros lotus TaxID=55363 RepID=UPI002256EDD0|nr:trans-resveratrol di-O-methyltransferase-like [Diospyros lotus]